MYETPYLLVVYMCNKVPCKLPYKLLALMFPIPNTLLNITIVLASTTTTMVEEFSITLPSNVLSKEDPNNSPSKFVTRLNKTIQLSGAWEVAATRLQLQNRWYNFPKSQMLGVYVRDIRTASNDAYDVSAGTERLTTSSEEQRFNQSASQWKNATWATDGFLKNMNYRCVTFPAGVYTSIEHIGFTLCSQIHMAFYDCFEDLELEYAYFTNEHGGYVKINNVSDPYATAQYATRIVSLVDPGDLDVMEVLGFAAAMTGVFKSDKVPFKYYGTVQVPAKQQLASHEKADLYRYCHIVSKVVDKPTVPMVRQLMLYADIAALRNVGNLEAQLLDSVVVHANVGEYEDALRGVTPNYVPVYRNTFSTIEIELTDYAGDRLLFPNNYNSPVIVTLRFRRAKSNK